MDYKKEAEELIQYYKNKLQSLPHIRWRGQLDEAAKISAIAHCDINLRESHLYNIQVAHVQTYENDLAKLKKEIESL